jgi:hypothetical protein
VPPDRDAERQTHSGILHYAPNQWLFDTLVQNEQIGTLTIEGLLPQGWSTRFGNSAWRTIDIVGFPDQLVVLMDNVNYFVVAHGHRDARESYGLSTEVVPIPNPGDFDNVGSHDALHVRPAVFADGHAEPLPSTSAYWLGEQATYRGGAGAPGMQFYTREVQRFMWFINPHDHVTDD